jgi:hypothetical protein
VPDAPEGEKSPRKSRHHLLEDEGIEPEMPQLEWGEYLIQYLFEFGPTVLTGMGSGPVSPPHIESWQRQLGLSLSPWEVRLLLRLSGEYAGESAAASKPDRPPPFKESSDGARLQAARLQRNMDKFLD